MTVVVIGGHLQGEVPGLIIGLLATGLSSLFKFFLNAPNLLFEFASIIPHGIMGYVAGVLGNKKNSKLSSLAIILGHFLNLIFYGIFGLIQFEEIILILVHIGFIAEIMLNLSIIILGIILLQKHFYNSDRPRKERKSLQWIRDKGTILPFRNVLDAFKIILLIGVLIIITISVYSGSYKRENTRFYLILYLIPVIFSAYWFGLKGSLPISALSSIIIAHEIFFPSLYEINNIYDQITFFIIFFNLIAIIMGELKRREESSKSKIKDMKFQEEKYHNMLSHFLFNYLQKGVSNLELLQKKYKINKEFDHNLLNNSIKNIMLGSVITEKVDEIMNLLQEEKPTECEWQEVLSVIEKEVENFRQKSKDRTEFVIESPERLKWLLLSDENLKKIFQNLFSFLLTSKKVTKITVDSSTTKKNRVISIKCENPPKISKEACLKLTKKITERWIYHGYYLRISHAAMIIQHYGGLFDINFNKKKLEFIIKFPLQYSKP
ncbi:MAG: hypothetical protein R6U96_09940 [Promethearchaeia archaeon]